MRTNNKSIFLFALAIYGLLFSCSCKQEHTCPSQNAKVYLEYKDQFVPYKGNEQLNFLHNNNDTQIFIGQGKTTYYITDNTVSDLGGCPMDHESVKIKF